MASRRTQKRPGTTVRRQVNPVGSAGEEIQTRATHARVAVLEAVERAGGNIRDVTYGVCPRIVRMGGPRLERPSTVYAVLRGMEEQGWVILDEVPLENRANAYRIIEVQLIEIPDHFIGPIAKLRKQRGIKHFDPDDPAVTLAVARRVEERVAAAAVAAAVGLSPSATPVGPPPTPPRVDGDVRIMGMTPDEVIEKIISLEAQVEELRITNAALVKFVRENQTEVNL